MQCSVRFNFQAREYSSKQKTGGLLQSLANRHHKLLMTHNSPRSYTQLLTRISIALFQCSHGRYSRDGDEPLRQFDHEIAIRISDHWQAAEQQHFPAEQLPRLCQTRTTDSGQGQLESSFKRRDSTTRKHVKCCAPQGKSSSSNSKTTSTSYLVGDPSDHTGRSWQGHHRVAEP